MIIYIKNLKTKKDRTYLRNRAYKILIQKLKIDFNIKIKHNDILHDKNGKPYINNNIFFNISYSESLLCIAISNENVGIDIEKIKNASEIIINKIYTQEEKNFLNFSNNINYDFTKIWTYKEALVKYTGVGINDDFKKLNVINENKYIKKEFQSFDYLDYIITIYSKDRNIKIDVI